MFKQINALSETISTHCVYLVDLNYFNLEFLKYFSLKSNLQKRIKMKAVTLQITVFLLIILAFEYYEK